VNVRLAVAPATPFCFGVTATSQVPRVSATVQILRTTLRLPTLTLPVRHRPALAFVPFVACRAYVTPATGVITARTVRTFLAVRGLRRSIDHRTMGFAGPAAATATVLDAAAVVVLPAVAATAPPELLAGVTPDDGVEAVPPPATFAATTANVYATPFVRPVTEHDVAGVAGATDDVEHCSPPGDAVTVYDVIVAPPSDAGAVHDTSAEPSAATPPTPVAAPGVVRGVTADDAADAALVPLAFVAVAVKVYAVPFVRPVTEQLIAGGVKEHDLELSCTAVTV